MHVNNTDLRHTTAGWEYPDFRHGKNEALEHVASERCYHSKMLDEVRDVPGTVDGGSFQFYLTAQMPIVHWSLAWGNRPLGLVQSFQLV